jgi:hypothetical protein
MPLNMAGTRRPGHVVFQHIGGAADDADQRVQHDGGKHEQVADPHARHAFLFQRGQRDQEAAKPAVNRL